MPARDRLSSISFGPSVSLPGILVPPDESLAPVIDTPEGFSPLALGTSFAGLEGIAADQARLERETNPPNIIPTDLPHSERLAILDRMETIRSSVPGIEGPKLLELAYHHGDVNQAISIARAQAEAKPTSWWQHVAAPFKAVFIDAPEWVWRKAIVDPFQEFAELVGIDPEFAQQMSPGQVIVAAVPGDWGTEDESGNLLDPEEWDGAARWASGGLDLVARLTLDPTLVLGKFRQTLALPGGAEKLLGLTRVHQTGRAARVARLQNLVAAGDVVTAQRVAGEIIQGNRKIKNYLAGYISASDIARDALTHSGIRSFTRDVVRATQDSPDAVATLLRKYGTLRRGFGIREEQMVFLADAARRGVLAGRIRGDEFAGGIRQVEQALTSLITGRFTPSLQRSVDDLVRQHASAVAIRNDALHVIDSFHANRAVEVTDVALNRRPFLNAKGRVIAEEIELSIPGRTDLGDTAARRARADAESVELSIPGQTIPGDEASRALSRSRAEAEFAEGLPSDIDAPLPAPSHAPLPTDPPASLGDPTFDIDAWMNENMPYWGRDKATDTWKRFSSLNAARAASKPGAGLFPAIDFKATSKGKAIERLSPDAAAAAQRSFLSSITDPNIARAVVLRGKLPIALSQSDYVSRIAILNPDATTGTFVGEHAQAISDALSSGHMVAREALESSPSYRGMLEYAEQHGLIAERASDVGKPNVTAQLAGVDVEASRSRRAREQVSPSFPPAPAGRIPEVPPTTGVGDIVPTTPRSIPGTVPDTGVGDLVPPRPTFTDRELALSQVETGIPSDIPISIADADAARQTANTYAAEIARVGEKLRPTLGVTELSSDDIADIVHGIKTVNEKLHITSPLGEFPYATIFNRSLDWLGSSKLRNVPLARNLLPEYLPHRALNVEDPYWFVQVNRLGKLFDMDNTQIDSYISRARSSGGPFHMRRVVEEMMDTGYLQKGITPELLAELKRETSERTHKIFAIVDGKAIDRPVLESEELNTIWLTDPKFIRLLMRRSKGGSFARTTAAEFRASFTDALDRYQQIFKRLMISAPRTGLRVLMEGQARALAYGFTSAIPDPTAWFDTFAFSVVSPQRALNRLRRRSGEAADVALGARDLGMSQMLYESGLLSPRQWRDRQVTRFSKMSTDWQRHQYRMAQAEYINDFILNDRLARQIIFSDAESALTWLRSPQAASYRSLKSLSTADDIARHHAEVLDIVASHKVLEPKLRAVAAGRPGVPGRAINAEDLIGLEADAIVGANIHGAWAGKNFQEKVSHLLDMAVQRNLASIEFVGRDYTTRRELFREVWDRVGQAERSGRKVNHEAVRTLLRGGVVEGSTSALERSIVKAAKTDIFERVKFLFFDMAEHSRASETLRFVFPFGNAFQEVISRWGAILAERPWVPHLGAAMFGASDDLPGLTYTDPATGEKMFRIPLSGHLLKFAGLRSPNPLTGLPANTAFELTGRLEGFNMVTSGFPIPGPYAQISSWFLLRNKPAAHDVLQVLFPYGQGNIVESLQPGWFREMRNYIETYLDSDLSNVDLASVAADLGMEEIYAILKRSNALDDPTKAREELATIEDIDEGRYLSRVRHLFAIRAASRIFFPAVVRERSPLRDQIEFYREISQTDPNFANQVFLARYGPEFLALVEERTVRTKPHLPPPTKEARRRLLTDPSLHKFVDHFGTLGWDVLKETWTGDLDSDMLRDQIVSGERRRRTLPEIRQAAISAVGWEYYFLYQDQLERRLATLGVSSINAAAARPLKSARDEFLSKMRFAFPDWAAEFSRGGPRNTPRNVASLSIIANVPELQGLDGIMGLKKYFALRRQIIRQMQMLGYRSLEGSQAIGLKMAMQDQVREIVRVHPSFARLWGRYLTRDPLTPLDQLILETGALDQAGILREVAA